MFLVSFPFPLIVAIHSSLKLLIKMDFYELSQLDFNVLEEKINDNLDILKKKDAVSKIKLKKPDLQ